MAIGSFQPGQRFTINGVVYRISRHYEDGRRVLEDLQNGRIREETLDSLLGSWGRGDLRFHSTKTLKEPAAASSIDSALHGAFEDAYRQSYPDALWRKAQAKLYFVRKLEGLPITAHVIQPCIRSAWEEAVRKDADFPFKTPPHFVTVAKWLRDYTGAGCDIRALVDRHHEKGTTDSRVAEAIDTIAEDVIETFYLTLERRSRQSVLDELRGRVAKENVGRLPFDKLSLPGLKYLKRKIAEIPPYQRYAARYGKRAADIKFRASAIGQAAEVPLARVCVDHCRLDLMVIDGATGLPLGRPWLTLIIDECSRYVLGFYLGFEEPSVVSIQHAVKHAVSPKSELLAASPKVVNTWDAWGIFDYLVADNGMELHADAIERAIGQFGVKLQFCPRRKPWYKGKIERFFRTVKTGFVDRIPGKTFGNILEKGDYDPEKHAVISLETLRQTILIWIVDIYHKRTHRVPIRRGHSFAELASDHLTSGDRICLTPRILRGSATS